jgi:hypothetical protein
MDYQLINTSNDTIPLEPGDIAFKHPDITPDWFPVIIEHCLIYIDYNQTTEKYIFIEANQVHQKVQYRNETLRNITGTFWGPFGRVRKTNSNQKQNAIDFIKRQLGKPFQNNWTNKNYNPEDVENDTYANEWYCSELIWAAYYNCDNPFPEKEPDNGYIYGEGIDLDKNKWKKEFGPYSVVRPKEIANNLGEIEKFYLVKSKIKILNLFSQFFSPIFLILKQSLMNHRF